VACILVDGKIRILRQQFIVRSGGANDLVSGSDKIWLDQVVIVLDTFQILPIAARRSARAEGGDVIIVAAVSPERVGSSDRDRGRLIARRMNASKNLWVRRVLTIISGSSYDHNTRIDQSSHGAANRIILI